MDVCVLFLILAGTLLVLLPLSVMSAVGVSDALHQVEEVPFNPQFAECLYREGCRFLSKVFSVSLEMIMQLLSFIL